MASNFPTLPFLTKLTITTPLVSLHPLTCFKTMKHTTETPTKQIDKLIYRQHASQQECVERQT